jgi:hypothetical protein
VRLTQSLVPRLSWRERLSLGTKLGLAEEMWSAWEEKFKSEAVGCAVEIVSVIEA